MSTGLRKAVRRLPGLRDVVRERDRYRAERDYLLAERYGMRVYAQRLLQERDALLGLAGAGDRTDRPTTDLGYLVIVTYGRSGSTLLQGVLNSIPGYLIRGENRQIMLRLYEYHLSAMSDQRRVRTQMEETVLRVPAAEWTAGEDDDGAWTAVADPESVSNPRNPFFGIEGYQPEVAVDHFRRLTLDTLLRPRPDTRVVGFKEIRWPPDQLMSYLRFLQTVLPGCRFLVNTRDLGAVASSKWWQGEPDALAKLVAFEESMVSAAAELGSSAFLVRYDDWKGQPDALRPMFDWLGEPFDPAVVESVMAVRHSY